MFLQLKNIWEREKWFVHAGEIFFHRRRYMQMTIRNDGTHKKVK